MELLDISQEILESNYKIIRIGDSLIDFEYKGNRIEFTVHENFLYISKNGHLRGEPKISLNDPNLIVMAQMYMDENFR